ncbi:MAG: hypothetical protein Fur002_14870 [Anaerolineales bacterium]
MQAPVLHVIGLANIVRERLLPVPGETLARLNQKVSSGDVVAEARFAREHVLLDVARILRVSPKMANSLIKCKFGETLTAGAEIAVGRGLFPRVVKAPCTGRVVVVGGGQVLLETSESKIELRAGIPGIVTEVIPERGVVIQAAGSLIQGVWGNGRIDAGQMVNLMEKPDSVLTASQLDVSFRGAVILSGIVKDPETLKVAAELQIRGLILASIYPSLLPLAREMRFPIMATDGFGPLPMNSLAYQLLKSNAKRDVTVNAEAYDRYGGGRPEVIIPLPVTEAPDLAETVEFAPGLQVRMRRPPALGALGSILSIKPGQTVLPSGLRAPAAEIKLENGETALAPLVNLEVVG